ncbi:MAG: FHA domain-containing protein [Planctomycetes bacterium]|nr:FHA domain-containing protein [Planctomycetota bacterium]
MVGPQKKVYFFFLSGAKKGKIEGVPATGAIRIGRQHDASIQLDPYEDIPASGDHAQVVCEGDERFFLEDRGSSWGTFKNDIPVVSRVPLTTGDVITCGQDDQGRQGPRIKFYLEKDVLRCPGCDGPVYKRHFKCPGCRRKFCLRCIDFKTKSCKPCAPAVVTAPARAATGDTGFEVVEDDEEIDAKRPARVVVSGRDAKRFKRAQEKKKDGAPAKRPADPGVVAEPVDLDAPFCAVCCEFADGPTFTCPACRQTCCVAHRHGVVCPPCAGIAGSDVVSRASEPELKIPDLDVDAATARPVRGPEASGRRTVEASGRRGPEASGRRGPEASGRRAAPPPSGADRLGAGPGSGVGSGPGAGVDRPAPGSGAARLGSGPDRLAPGSGAGRVGSGLGSGADRAALPPTMRHPGPPPGSAPDVVLARPDPLAPTGAPPPALRAEPLRPPAPPPRPPAPEPPRPPGPPRPTEPGGRAPSPGSDPLLTRSKIDARRPPAIPCERCASPLSATSFFICERCRARLCGDHRSAGRATLCDRCGAGPSPFDAARAPLPYASTGGAPGLPPPRPPAGWPAPPVRPVTPAPRVPQDLIETAGDDVLPPLEPPPTPRAAPPPPRPGGPLGLSGQGAAPMMVSGAAVHFECPYCDEAIPPTATRCPRCAREL